MYTIAQTENDYATGRTLFSEYVASLGIDLSFQDFQKELTVIEQQYGPPEGGLLLAWQDDTAIGCVGIRGLDVETAELKRMYVRKEYRGRHIGTALLERSLELARNLGYKKIRLDTLDNMTSALTLYKAAGFHEIPAYRHNPLKGAVFMEKEL